MCSSRTTNTNYRISRVLSASLRSYSSYRCVTERDGATFYIEIVCWWRYGSRAQTVFHCTFVHEGSALLLLLDDDAAAAAVATTFLLLFYSLSMWNLEIKHSKLTCSSSLKLPLQLNRCRCCCRRLLLLAHPPAMSIHFLCSHIGHMGKKTDSVSSTWTPLTLLFVSFRFVSIYFQYGKSGLTAWNVHGYGVCSCILLFHSPK